MSIYIRISCHAVAEKENLTPLPVSTKKEDSHKREMNRDGEKEDRSKKLRKTESKENMHALNEKKQVRKLLDIIYETY